MIVEELESGGWNSKWWEEVQEAQEELGVGGRQAGENRKRSIDRAFWRREERIWREEVSERESLRVYPKERLRGASSTEPITVDKKEMRRIRLGVVWEENKVGHGQECSWCGEKPRNWIIHVMKECRKFIEEEGKIIQADKGQEVEEQIRNMLEDWSRENVRKVTERVRRFRRTWGEGSEEPAEEG